MKKDGTWVGILLVLVGGVWLLRLAGVPFPGWLFTWQTVLIVFGLFVGIKNGFRDFSWLIFVVIGGIFLIDYMRPDISFRRYMWPTIMLILGIMFIFAPKGPCRKRHQFYERMKKRRELMHGGPFNQQSIATGVAEPTEPLAAQDADDFDNTKEADLDIVSIFSGIKKKILSKEFNGGEIVCVFGGAQVNLSNADFNAPVVLDLVQIFGGTKLVVPANWEVRSEIATIFGGVDDKRPQPTSVGPEKTLILKGTIIFGGVEINSY